MKRAKNKVKQYAEDSIEKIIGGTFDQILGTTDSKEKQKKNRGDLIEGQELNLKGLQGKNLKNEEASREVEAGIDYLTNYSREIGHAAEMTVGRESQEIEAQLREIMAEIKKLADTSKELQMQFKEVAIEQHVAKPGKYHKNFFSWLLSIIKSARMKVEDSEAWLAAMQSKKKSRGYWQMANKGANTSFTLSNERNVATQVG